MAFYLLHNYMDFILFFFIDYTPSIYMALYYLLVCMIILIYFKKAEMKKANVK